VQLHIANCYQQGEDQSQTTMTMKEKRLSFFTDPQEGKVESRHSFGTLPFARHSTQRFAKVKEPNLADTQFNYINDP